jgi:hypothetical protein
MLRQWHFVSSFHKFKSNLLVQRFFVLLKAVFDMIYLLTAIELTFGGSSTVHIYTQTIYRTTQSTQTIHRKKQSTQTIHRTTQSTPTIYRKHNRHKQYIEQHNRYKQYIEQHNRHKQYIEQHNRHKQYKEQHNQHKQYIEQHTSSIRKNADRAPSLRGIPWHLPYNWGKTSVRVARECQLAKNIYIYLFIYKPYGTKGQSNTTLFKLS